MLALARNRSSALRLARTGTRALCKLPDGVIVDNEPMATGMEKKELDNASDIFWSREPIMGHKGTRENPAIIPSFNASRCVGLETEQVRASPEHGGPGEEAMDGATMATGGARSAMRPRARGHVAVLLHQCILAHPPCPFARGSQGVIWFRLEKGPLHLVADQYFKLEQVSIREKACHLPKPGIFLPPCLCRLLPSSASRSLLFPIFGL